MTEQQRKAMEAALSFIVVSSAKDKAWYTAEEFEVVAALRQALAQPEWVGLTDAEVEAWRGNYDFFDSALVREVEAKLKEKNT